MFRLARPAPAQLDAVLAAHREAPFSYAEVGATRGAPGAPAPPGYAVDHNRALLGAGPDAFRRAVEAVRAWRMFALGWCAVHPPAGPIAPGVAVAAVVRHYGFWSVNVSRVVYVLDGSDLDAADAGADVRRFGFAYGTTRAHGEVGEERFSVEWDRRDGRVWYDLYAFSRPGHPLARLGAPLARRLQRRFARDSLRAMAAAVR